MFRVVNRIVQSATFLTFKRPAGNKVAHVYHIAKFANIRCSLHTLKELFCFFKEKVKSCPCALQSKVRTHDSDVVSHDLPYLSSVLGNKDLFFISKCSLVIPLRHAFAS